MDDTGWVQPQAEEGRASRTESADIEDRLSHVASHQSIYCSAITEECTEQLREMLQSGHDTMHMITQQVDMARKLDGVLDVLGETELWSKDQLSETVDWEKSAMRYRRLWAETLISRSVDRYLTYIAKVLAQIFVKRPETLRSSRQVRLDYVLRHDSMEDLIRDLADEQVNQLAYKGMNELSEEVRRLVGLDLFTDQTDLDFAVQAIETRNILVHNNGIVNAIMIRKAPNFASQLGAPVDLARFADFSEFLGQSAIAFDRRARVKFSLPTLEGHQSAESCSQYVIKSRRSD